MKTTLTLMILMIGINFNLAQQKAIDSSFVKEKHLKSYKPLMKTANILLASGGGLMLVGGILISTDNTKSNGWVTIISGQEFAGALLIVGGIVTSLVSVPFYISAIVRKKKLNISPLITYEQQKIIQIPITNFGITINF